MEKSIITAAAIIATAISVWLMQPVQPHHYELHNVTYGETMTNIIEDANRNSDVNYDIRDAVSIAVNESSKMEGGAKSRQLQVGDKVAVPIYR